MEDEYITSIKIPCRRWRDIREKIIAVYGKSITISWVMRRELGFTVREAYFDWTIGEEPNVWLDFYDAAQKTLFLLKYWNSDES
jgi:hypothetical protein